MFLHKVEIGIIHPVNSYSVAKLCRQRYDNDSEDDYHNYRSYSTKLYSAVKN